MEENKNKNWHDKSYKWLLLIPLILLVFSAAYLIHFNSINNDLVYKDISLIGGTSVTIQGSFDSTQVEADLFDKLNDLNVREVFDLVTREKKALIIETTSEGDLTRQFLEQYFGHKLNTENSSFEFTGSNLGQSFFKQLILAIIYAFILMGIVVFFLFAKQKKIKALLVFLGLISPFLFFVCHALTLNQTIFFSILILIITSVIYLKYNIPSFAVIISAFADILMTLTLVNLLGIKMSSAGIIAFLMLIGYSVDTDILLTNRILKETGSINKKIFSSFKTGMTMTLTSLVAFLAALIIVSSFSAVLTKIFTILVIGLGFDLINTWITNVSLLKWHFGEKQ